MTCGCNNTENIRRALGSTKPNPSKHPCSKGESGTPCGDTTKCRLCYLFANDPAYKRLWSVSSQKGTVVRFSMHANGIGDAISGLIAVAGYKKQHPKTFITYLCRHHDWVGLFDGYDFLGPVDDTGTNINQDYHHECNTKGEMPRWERYCKNAGSRPTLPNLKDCDKLKEEGKAYKDVVLLCPFSVYQNRCASILHWLTTERHLIKAGYRTVILHDEPYRPSLFTGEKVIGAAPGTLAGIMLNAACAIGVDSGLLHLSSMVGCPTLVLSGPSDPQKVYFAGVTTIPGKLSCNGCYWQYPYSAACDTGCASMNSIDPEQVLAAVDAVVLPGRAPNSLLCPKKLAVLRNGLLATNHLEGVVGEFGTYKGGSAKLMTCYTQGPLHLFDTFQGQPEDDQGGEHVQGDFGDTSVEAIKALLAEHAAIFLHPGVFPKNADPSLKFRFVHADMDTYQATKAIIEYCRPRMAKGGIMVFDDYGWHKTPGVAKAVHEGFAAGIEHVSEYQVQINF